MKVSSIKESFADLLNNTNRINFRDFLKSNFGELDYIEFKSQWIEIEKVAKHILAITNSGGGLIIFGVEENNGKINSIGLNEIIDKANIQQKLNDLLPHKLEYEILDLHYEETEYKKIKSKSFQVIIIPKQINYIPFLATAERSSLKKDTIYIRRGTQSIQANYEELQDIFNKRISSEYNSSSEIELEEHLNQLKLLYSQLKKYYYLDPVFENISDEEKKYIQLENELYRRINKYYPTEDYEEFIEKMIKFKKDIVMSKLR